MREGQIGEGGTDESVAGGRAVQAAGRGPWPALGTRRKTRHAHIRRAATAGAKQTRMTGAGRFVRPSSRTCSVTSPPTPAMATVIAHPQDTPQPVVSPPPEAIEALPDKISAYYSLVFPNFTYYLQTLTVTIGRRCVPANTASTSDNPQVDVDLGPLKSVSRLHAKIEYDEDEERFVLFVIGRNGAWVDGVWSGSGSKVPLGDRCVD